MVESMYKYAHGHIQPGKQVPDFFLIFRRTVHHAIVFNSAKTQVITIADLITEIPARTILKHTVVKSIIQFEGFVCSWFDFSLLSQHRHGGQRNSSSGNSLLDKISSFHNSVLKILVQ